MASSDYPLSEVPAHERHGFWSCAVILLGFTFFTATMWGGSKLGTAFSLYPLLALIVVGNLLLGIYAAALAYIACKSGLNSVLMARFCFGEVGSKLSDILLGFTQIGWYAWGTATVSIALVKATGLASHWQLPLMVLFGLLFCFTAMIGYRGMDWLARFAVPLMMLFILISLYKGWLDIGGVTGLTHQHVDGSLSITEAITIIIGTFVSGGTQATNWSRFARTPRVAVWATLLAFVVGNGLMVLTGAMGALIYQQADVVEVLLAQGFISVAVLMLFLNIWTTQDNTIYNFAVAGCNLLRTRRRRLVTLAGAIIGTGLAVGGFYDLLVPFLQLLATFIPPLGGVIMADFWFAHRGQYPSLATSQLPRFNWPGLASYALGSTAAVLTPVLPPVIGVIIAAISYGLLIKQLRPTPLAAVEQD